MKRASPEPADPSACLGIIHPLPAGAPRDRLLLVVPRIRITHPDDPDVREFAPSAGHGDHAR